MPSVLSPIRNFSAALAALALSGTSAAWAEDKIKILFLPPPMEGTLSLGIYDAEGILVRVLHDEAGTDEFHPAFNGLITHWDGNNDDGERCPPGTYRASGYMVGDLKVEGIDYHGNGWYLDDDSPRLRRLTRIAGLPEGRLLLEALQPGSETPALFIASPEATPESNSDASTKAATSDAPADANGDEPDVWKAEPAPAGTVFPESDLFRKADSPRLNTFEGVTAPGDDTIAPDGNIWGIDGKTFSEFSPDGTNQRSLFPLDGNLAPLRITATEKLLFVLMQSPTEQRLQGLPYNGPGQAVVDTAILFTDTPEQALPILTFPDQSPFQPSPLVKVALIANPLLKEGQKAGSVKLAVVPTPEGTLLVTEDGLTLQQISTTPNLRWAVIGQQKGKKALTLFESDGAVVAEYRISSPANMMAFNAGSYKLDAAKEQPTPTPDPEPEEALPATSPEVSPEPESAPTPEPSATPESTPDPTPVENPAGDANF